MSLLPTMRLASTSVGLNSGSEFSSLPTSSDCSGTSFPSCQDVSSSISSRFWLPGLVRSWRYLDDKTYFKFRPKMQTIWRIFECFQKFQTPYNWPYKASLYQFNLKRNATRLRVHPFFQLEKEFLHLFLTKNALFVYLHQSKKLTNLKNHKISNPVSGWPLENGC